MTEVTLPELLARRKELLEKRSGIDKELEDIKVKSKGFFEKRFNSLKQELEEFGLEDGLLTLLSDEERKKITENSDSGKTAATRKQSSRTSTRTNRLLANPFNLTQIFKGGNPRRLSWYDDIRKFVAQEEGKGEADITWDTIKKYLVELDSATKEPLNEEERAKVKTKTEATQDQATETPQQTETTQEQDSLTPQVEETETPQQQETETAQEEETSEQS